jgi:sensor histidine kinase YesM
MSFNANPIVLLFLACILSGFAILNVAPYISGLLSLPVLKIIGVLAILIFSFVIIFIGLRTLFNGGWR